MAKRCDKCGEFIEVCECNKTLIETTALELLNLIDPDYKEIESKLKEFAKEYDKQLRTNIGFLRQWINEKPENLLVTNEHIEEWLFNFEPTKKK